MDLGPEPPLEEPAKPALGKPFITAANIKIISDIRFGHVRLEERAEKEMKADDDEHPHQWSVNLLGRSISSLQMLAKDLDTVFGMARDSKHPLLRPIVRCNPFDQLLLLNRALEIIVTADTPETAIHKLASDPSLGYYSTS